MLLLPVCDYPGEHIKTWRPRYFVLWDTGVFLGFKSKPEDNLYADPLNNFNVKGKQYQFEF